MILEDIDREIKQAESIVILTHEGPDGDAIGSGLSLYNGLLQLGKKVDLIIPEYAKNFSFLPKSEEIKSESDKQYDLAIALDCGDLKRLNGNTKYFENANSTIQIDHHGVNTMFAEYNFVDPTAPACCQILVGVLEYLKIVITKEIGICLLTGIITDSGGFKYSGVNSSTFEITAELIDKGVNVSEVYRKVLQTFSKERFELTKIAINRLEILENEKIAFTYTTREEEQKIKTNVGDHEGIVEYGRDIEGVEVSIYLREVEENLYKVSLRSNDYVDVSDICLIFNGGGHIRAAGCNINLPLIQAKERIINECKKHLK